MLPELSGRVFGKAEVLAETTSDRPIERETVFRYISSRGRASCIAAGDIQTGEAIVFYRLSETPEIHFCSTVADFKREYLEC